MQPHHRQQQELPRQVEPRRQHEEMVQDPLVAEVEAEQRRTKPHRGRVRDQQKRDEEAKRELPGLGCRNPQVTAAKEGVESEAAVHEK